VLFGNLLLLLPLLPGVLVVHLGLLEAGDEVVEYPKELVALCGDGVLAEQPAHPVKLYSRRKTFKGTVAHEMDLSFDVWLVLGLVHTRSNYAAQQQPSST
jgi:hypothetical protein